MMQLDSAPNTNGLNSEIQIGSQPQNRPLNTVDFTATYVGSAQLSNNVLATQTERIPFFKNPYTCSCCSDCSGIALLVGAIFIGAGIVFAIGTKDSSLDASDNGWLWTGVILASCGSVGCIAHRIFKSCVKAQGEQWKNDVQERLTPQLLEEGRNKLNELLQPTNESSTQHLPPPYSADNSDFTKV